MEIVAPFPIFPESGSGVGTIIRSISPLRSATGSGMARLKPLTSEKLYKRCDPAMFAFRTTAGVKDLDGVLGQDRAVAAVEFGLGIRRKGYNLFAMGPSGSGKHSLVRRFLDDAAAKADPKGVFDWCYVNDFVDGRKPAILRLPVGMGRQLSADMDRLAADLLASVPMMFESDEYRARLREIEEEFTSQEERPLEEMRARARKRDISIIRTPAGLGIAPMRGGEPLDHDAYEKLNDAEREKITRAIEETKRDLQELARQAPRWRRELAECVRDLAREIIAVIVRGLLADVRKNYAAAPGVKDYLDAVEKDAVENAEAFRQQPQGPENPTPALPAATGFVTPAEFEGGRDVVARYRVNVLIDHRDTEGCPVVYEDSPTYENLLGTIEHLTDMGALITDFTLIKAGALHKANGGYLMVDARQLLGEPYAWEGLKRALLSGHLRIEPLGKRLSVLSTVTLEPEPVPLEVKVVLIGERRLFYLLQRHDPDFDELFKVTVDFEEDMPRTVPNMRRYARMIATFARGEGLLPLSREAVARVIEHGSRLAEDAGKLTVQMLGIFDLAREADHIARAARRKVIGAGEVREAIRARAYRVSRLPERMRERIHSGTVLLDTKGERVGQINALTVYQLGGFSFGQPTRVTARARQGSGKVIDIEREVNLGGTLHSKGVLILSSYLSATFLPGDAFSLVATLVFEQNYGGIDGDSASSTELYALLSAISEVPIRQCFAVTGSVNQFGEVQAIGGVNEKIEGFFDVCAEAGLTGEQGVLIPESNVRHLMLKEEVRAAVAEGRFAIHPVRTITEGIELLTGMPAGQRGKDGKFPADTVYGKAEARLVAFNTVKTISAGKDAKENNTKAKGLAKQKEKRA